MTVPASEGVFSFGGQTGRGTLAGTFYRHKMLDVNIGTQQAVQYFPQEVGGGVHPTGAFKGVITVMVGSLSFEGDSLS